MAPHSSTLAWKIPWTEEPRGLQPMGSLRVGHKFTFTFTFTFHFHALEKEMATHSSVLAWRIPGTGEAWWASVYGVAQSWTRLKRLSSSSRAKPKLGTTIPRGAGGAEPTCLCRRHKRLRFNPWFRKIPQRRAWQPTPVFLSGESHGRRSHRVTKS